jgi:hypothetical protein
MLCCLDRVQIVIHIRLESLIVDVEDRELRELVSPEGGLSAETLEEDAWYVSS